MRTGGILHRRSLCSQFLPMPSTSLRLHYHYEPCCSCVCALFYVPTIRYPDERPPPNNGTASRRNGFVFLFAYALAFALHIRTPAARTHARTTAKTNGTRPVGTAERPDSSQHSFNLTLHAPPPCEGKEVHFVSVAPPPRHHSVGPSLV